MYPSTQHQSQQDSVAAIYLLAPSLVALHLTAAIVLAIAANLAFSAKTVFS